MAKVYVYKDKHKYYRVSVVFDEKIVILGTYKDKDKAEEIKNIFENECNSDISKFNALNVGVDEYKRDVKPKGNVYIQKKGTYRAQIFCHGKNFNLGTFSDEQIAKNALAYFIEINYDFDKYCESDYWLTLRNTYKNNKRTKKH